MGTSMLNVDDVVEWGKKRIGDDGGDEHARQLSGEWLVVVMTTRICYIYNKYGKQIGTLFKGFKSLTTPQTAQDVDSSLWTNNIIILVHLLNHQTNNHWTQITITNEANYFIKWFVKDNN